MFDAVLEYRLFLFSGMKYRMSVLSLPEKPARTGTFHDPCSAQRSDKTDTVPRKRGASRHSNKHTIKTGHLHSGR
jgi:hypothetical protein